MQGRRPPCLALLRFSWGGGVALGGDWRYFVATAVVMGVFAVLALGVYWGIKDRIENL